MESEEEFSNAESLPSQNSASPCGSYHNDSSNCVLGNLRVSPDAGLPPPSNVVVSPNTSNVRRSASGVLRCEEDEEEEEELSENLHSPQPQPVIRGEYETDSIFQEDTDPFDG